MYSNFEFQITRDGQADKAIEQWPVPLQGGSIGRSPDCTWVLKDHGSKSGFRHRKRVNYRQK